MRAALALTLIDLLTFGAVDVLVPLHLGAGGTSVGVIAAALGAGAALGAVTGPIAGRMVDRIGAQQVGLVTAACIVVIPVVLALRPPTSVQLAILVIGGPLFALVGSAIFPLSSSGADAAGVAHGASTTVAYLIMVALSVPVLAILRRNAADPLPSDARA